MKKVIEINLLIINNFVKSAKINDIIESKLTKSAMLQFSPNNNKNLASIGMKHY